MSERDDWPVCWCPLSGPNFGHLWDRRHCPEAAVEKWHGTPGGYSNHKCRCDQCRAARLEYQRNYRKRKPSRARQATKYVARYKRKGGVGNRGKLWTGAELEYITARGDDGEYLRSALEAADHLGRTVLAIERARHKCLHDPKYIAHVGNGEQP